MLNSGDSVERYVAEHPLGRGGLAEVWAARHKVLGTLRAVKILHQAGDSLRRRLVEEGRVQAQLDHPNVLPVLDVLSYRGAPVLVMPLVDGPSLAGLLAAHRPALDEAVALFRGVVDGMAHAHARGIVHRDLKPGNVLLDLQRGRVVPRVADFGLAKALGSHASATRAGAVLGSPGYASPEQLGDADRADHRADLWGLGVLLYELLTGVLPFTATRLHALLLLMERADFAPPSTRVQGLGAGWDALVADLLRHDPDARLQSCALLAHRIDSLHPRTSHDPLGAGGTLATATWRLRGGQSRDDTPNIALQRTTGGATVAAPHKLHNLPPERDAFVGRVSSLARLEEQLESGARLVTITGPGGTGKTRLALELGRRTLDRWPGGVWFCDVSEATSAAGITYAVASALDVPLQDADPVEQLAKALAGRGRCLVILDNFEQVVDYAVGTLGRWLDRVGDASFVVTTRERLRLHGEKILPVGPLTVPGSTSLAEAAESAAVTLFVGRARDVKPGFALDDSNVVAVVKLVRLLEGLPLAIELAAARARTQRPERLLERLSKSFDLLSSRSRDTSARHQTLRATLDWSWSLLAPWERSALAQLSVFDGGCTLEAAEAVIDLDAFASEAPWVEDVLAELVDKSLVRIWTPEGSDDPRFSALGMVLTYAKEKLRAEDGFAGAGAELRAATVRRHGEFYAALFSDDVRRALDGRGGAALRRELTLEIENLVAATVRASRRGDVETAHLAALGAWAVVERRGPLSGAPGWLQDARSTGESRWDADLMLAEGTALTGLGKWGLARQRLQQALDRAAEVGRRPVAVMAHRHLGLVERELGDLAAVRDHLERGLAAAQALGDRRLEATLLYDLARSDIEEAKFDDAAVKIDAGLSMAKAVGDRRLEGALYGRRAKLGREIGQSVGAMRDVERAIAVMREVGDQVTEARWHNMMGVLLSEAGDLEVAIGSYQECVRLSGEAGDRRIQGMALGNQGHAYLLLDRLELARERFEAALAIHLELGSLSGEADVLHGLGQLALEQGRVVDALRAGRRIVQAMRAYPQRLAEYGTTLVRACLAAGHVDEARAMVDRGFAAEPRGWVLGLLKVTDAEVVLAEAGPAAARLALADARAVASQTDAMHADVEKALSRVEAAISAAESA